ncbi:MULTISPECIES: NlpC/P60 family protein [unclassified Arthrobacter]|uniref:NlpC/P60 family protein n=1 Tax=unclassified Arthrobacter TaxID=235627 RepID=UPI00344164EE
MTTRATIARHRAEVTKTNSLAVIAKAVGDNAGGMGRQAAVIAAASGLVLTSGIAANAAETNVQRESTSASATEVQSTAPATISAASSIAISYEKPAVTTAAAPVVEAPKPVVKVQEADTTAAATPAAGTAVNASVATKAPAATSGMGASIAAAAYAQIGVSQDCTMLATNALAAVGIHYHGWPAGYLSLGRTVSAAEAQPGDLAYYQNGGMGMAHIAVYVGNGMAVHGGWNGGTTALYSVNVGSGPVFIRVGG